MLAAKANFFVLLLSKNKKKKKKNKLNNIINKISTKYSQ